MRPPCGITTQHTTQVLTAPASTTLREATGRHGAFLPPPPPPCNSHALVQATVGVGTILIWDFCVAISRGGGALVDLVGCDYSVAFPKCGANHPRHHTGVHVTGVNHKGAHATRNHQGARHAHTRPAEWWGDCAPHTGQRGGEGHVGPPGRQMEGWKCWAACYGNTARCVVDSLSVEGNGQHKL